MGLRLQQRTVVAQIKQTDQEICPYFKVEPLRQFKKLVEFNVLSNICVSALKVIFKDGFLTNLHIYSIPFITKTFKSGIELRTLFELRHLHFDIVCTWLFLTFKVIICFFMIQHVFIVSNKFKRATIRTVFILGITEE